MTLTPITGKGSRLRTPSECDAMVLFATIIVLLIAFVASNWGQPHVRRRRRISVHVPERERI
jgi:hypothetical protein